jgi:alpha-tubulin suppressor-like RCC1 family protein
MRDPTNDLSRDMAVKITSYLESRKDFFAFSSANRKLRAFFKDDRERAINRGKIILSDNNSSFFLTFEGDLYACGVNSFGELGLGDTKNRNQWTKTGPPGKKIFRILSKSGSTFAFCDDGLYACGLNSVGQLGFSDKKIISPWVKIGPFGRRVSKLEVAAAKVFVCCEDGWYGSGRNFWGEFGPSGIGQRFHWAKIEIPGKIILELKAEDNHTFVCCEDGWYACGSNQHGELGREENQDRVEGWIKINPSGKTVLELRSKSETIFVRCEDGWYARGNNCFGQLGKGDKRDALHWFKIGIGGKDIDELHSSKSGVTTFIRYKDTWYASGYDPFSAPNIMLKHVRLFWVKLVYPEEKILEVMGGANNNIYIRFEEGWYTGSHGWLTEPTVTEPVWAKIVGPDGKEVLKILSGLRSIFILCDDGWYVIGDNSLGQLGVGDTELQSLWIKVECHKGREPEEKRLKMGF